MTSEELGGIVFVIGYVAVFAVAVKVFGIRRIVGFLGILVLLAVTIVFKTLGAVVSSRRY